MDYANDLKEHMIWNAFYEGRDTRKESLQGSLGLLLVEMSQGYAMLQSTHLHRFASGAKDDLITPELYKKVEARLEVVMHLFAETTFTHRAEILPMYQAAMFLHEHGYGMRPSDKGALTSWFGQVLYEKNREGRVGFASPFSKMTESVTHQREFWEIYLPRIIKICKEHTQDTAA